MLKSLILTFLMYFSLNAIAMVDEIYPPRLTINKKELEAGRPLKIFHPSILRSAIKYNVIFKGKNFEKIVLTSLVKDGELSVFVPFYLKDSSDEKHRKPNFEDINVDVSLVEIQSNKVKFEILPPPELKWKENDVSPGGQHIAGILIQLDEVIQQVTAHNPNDTNRIDFLEGAKTLLTNIGSEWEDRAAGAIISMRGIDYTTDPKEKFRYELMNRINAIQLVGTLEYLGFLNFPKELKFVTPNMITDWYQKISNPNLNGWGYIGYDNAINSSLTSMGFRSDGSKRAELIILGAGAAVWGIAWGIGEAVKNYQKARSTIAEDSANQLIMKENNAKRLAYAECVRAAKAAGLPPECGTPPAENYLANLLNKSSIQGISCSMNSVLNTAAIDGQAYINEINNPPNAPTACVTVALISPPVNGGNGVVQYDLTCSEAPAGFHKIVIVGPGLNLENATLCGGPQVINGTGLSGGNYSVSVTVFDINGNSSSVNVPFTVPGGTGDKKSLIALKKTPSFDLFKEYVLKPFNDLINSISASLGASTTNPPVNQQVGFFSNSTSSAYILNYLFNFSDGVSVSRCYGNMVRSFSSAGNYSATLTVTNNLGESNTSAPLNINVAGNGD